MGSELDELKPAAGHAMAGGYGDDHWPGVFKKGDDIYDPQVLSNAMKKSDGEGGGSKEDPGMNAGSSKVGGGDAGSGKDKAEAVGEDTPVGRKESGDEPKSSGDKGEGDARASVARTRLQRGTRRPAKRSLTVGPGTVVTRARGKTQASLQGLPKVETPRVARVTKVARVTTRLMTRKPIFCKHRSRMWIMRRSQPQTCRY